MAGGGGGGVLKSLPLSELNRVNLLILIFNFN